MAYDAAFVTRIGEAGNGVELLIGDGLTVSAQVFDDLFRQFDFEWHSCL
jgi:hypothetical protein